MPITVNENGVLYDLNEITVNENGVLYNLDTVHSNEDGTLYEIYSGWNSPDILTWTTDRSDDSIVPTNNGYNCTITRTLSIMSDKNCVTFTIKKPIKIIVNLDNYNSSSIRMVSWSLDDGPKQDVFGSSPSSFSVNIETAGEHSLQIYTKGTKVTFSVITEKI